MIKNALLSIPGHDLEVVHEVLDAERLLVDVGRVASSSQASHGGQVPAVSTHCLNYEDSTFGTLKKNRSYKVTGKLLMHCKGHCDSHTKIQSAMGCIV